jgi:uncharacterized protein YodC (DUF2158 family)
MLNMLAEGDLVKFKAGVPLMVVTGVSGQFAACEWFDANNQAQNKSFRLDFLNKENEVRQTLPPTSFRHASPLK